MENDYNQAVNELNAGGPISVVDASWIERSWNAMSQLDAIHGRSIGLHAVADPNAPALNPGERVAVSFRYTLLDSLLKRNILDSHMQDPTLRKKVFITAASLPCDKNDLGEASFLRRLGESAPDVAEKMIEEARNEGYDPEHPRLDGKFIAWMNQLP
jgi:hypothetical protein